MIPRSRTQRTRHNRERGFALPIVIATGLAMLTIGLIIIARSESDKAITSGQKLGAQVFALAEAGVANSLSGLNQLAYAPLLTRNYDPVDPKTGKQLLGPDSRPNTGDEANTDTDEWQGRMFNNGCTTSELKSRFVDTDASDTSSESTFALKAYRYTPGDEVLAKGFLLVEGRTGRNTTSRIGLEIPIEFVPIDGAFPGLFAETVRLGPVQIRRQNDNNPNTPNSANAICADCSVPTNACNNGEPTSRGQWSAIGAVDFPKQIDGMVTIGNPQLPDVPTLDQFRTCAGNSRPDCVVRLPPNLGGNVLPRLADVRSRGTDPDEVRAPYLYAVSSINLRSTQGQTASISIKTSGINDSRPVIPGPLPVYLFVEDDITLNLSNITNDGEPGNFRIYGPPAAPAQTILLNGPSGTGASITNVFIYAPSAKLTLRGNTNITGAVWVKEWNSSEASKTSTITVKDGFSNQLVSEPPGDVHDFSQVGRQPKTRPQSTWQTYPISADTPSPDPEQQSGF